VSLSDDLYKEIIIEHTQNPSFRGPLSVKNISESGVNRSCGDVIELELLVKDGVIKDIGLAGQSCSICTASGSLMAEAVAGQTLERAEAIIDQFKEMLVEDKEVHFPEDLEDLTALQGVRKYPVRVKCATLAWNTLEQALKTASDM